MDGLELTAGVQPETDSPEEIFDSVQITETKSGESADEKTKDKMSEISGSEQNSMDESDSMTEAQMEEISYLGYVYVCGAVNAPGVYPVTEDMRVFEAIECAGGFREDADEEWLNLAFPVTDGQQIFVYTLAETQAIVQEQAAGTTAQADRVSDQITDTVPNRLTAGTLPEADSDSEKAAAKVNLNTATKDELMTLPGIGESKADAILKYRTEYGGFERIEDIMNISGIKEAVFSKIKDDITVQ